MANRRLSMRKVREVLRLYHAAGMSIRAIAAALGCSLRRWAIACTAPSFAHAHLAAGHAIAGERMANELCRSHPVEPLARTTLARVLEDSGRYRDAVAPAREALARACDAAAGRVLLARS